VDSNLYNLTQQLIDDNVIISTTNLEGIIISASQAFCTLSGYTKDELIGQPHNIVRHPDVSKEIFKDMWNTIQSGKTWQGIFKNIKKNGDLYWVDATISPNMIDEKIVSYSAIRQDITSKKELEQQQDIIIEQSKSAAMGEMIAMLAHQWRQPLQATAMLIQQLTLEQMLDGKISEETIEHVVSGTQQQIDYMSKTIDDFRDFFKPDKNKAKIKVSNLIEKARELIAYTLTADTISLNINIKDDIELNIHINEIVQVLINIIKNARDVLVERIKENITKRKIELISYKLDTNIIIIIKDNAGGIPDDTLRHIFDAYFSTKKNKNGTGLGLYMSKNIIENHGHGLLLAYNEDDCAVFKITLPIK
jgi:PAS domain S-box-containing protein